MFICRYVHTYVCVCVCVCMYSYMCVGVCFDYHRTYVSIVLVSDFLVPLRIRVDHVGVQVKADFIPQTFVHAILGFLENRKITRWYKCHSRSYNTHIHAYMQTHINTCIFSYMIHAYGYVGWICSEIPMGALVSFILQRNMRINLRRTRLFGLFAAGWLGDFISTWFLFI